VTGSRTAEAYFAGACEQGGRGSDVRRDEVRRTETRLGDEPNQELTHRLRRQQFLAALGRAEAR